MFDCFECLEFSKWNVDDIWTGVKPELDVHYFLLHCLTSSCCGVGGWWWTSWTGAIDSLYSQWRLNKHRGYSIFYMIHRDRQTDRLRKKARKKEREGLTLHNQWNAPVHRRYRTMDADWLHHAQKECLHKQFHSPYHCNHYKNSNHRRWYAIDTISFYYLVEFSNIRYLAWMIIKSNWPSSWSNLLELELIFT